MLCVRSSIMSLFRLGTIEITPAASATLAAVHADSATYLARHQQGDWGEVDEVTQQDNALAVEYPVRKVSTQEGYARWAATYDHEKNALIALEEPYVDAIVATLPITSALDVGTGTGRHALKLARRGIAVTAIDPSLEMLTVAQNSARTQDFRLECRF